MGEKPAHDRLDHDGPEEERGHARQLRTEERTETGPDRSEERRPEHGPGNVAGERACPQSERAAVARRKTDANGGRDDARDQTEPSGP